MPSARPRPIRAFYIKYEQMSAASLRANGVKGFDQDIQQGCAVVLQQKWRTDCVVGSIWNLDEGLSFN